ncbi:MAG: flagellar motor protein MotB [Bdellovibrionota bacterium]|nr:type VI secretion system protein TssL [Pseudobdellovibrionaceae bacterium]|tara:strand:- start:72950 stop:73795 length:846 start_codon:yes stop_codon:yes gene_type:complete
MSDEEEECDCPAGAPGWLATFADLMSLLMCFFVLLLSFAEMNVPKFKQASGSLKNAFGIQRVVIADAIPMGNSTIMTEFSPGKPDLVQFDTLAQDFQINVPTLDEFEEKKEEEEQKIVDEKAQELEQALQEDIAKGNIELEKQGKNVVLRVKEQASFPSGSDKFQKQFIPSLQKIMKALKKVKGKITVAGHTDDVPIQSKKFRSNWDLSSSRAVTVTQAFIKYGKMPAERFEVRGHADTQPLVKNRDAESRAKNRRVEIIIGMDSKELLGKMVEAGYLKEL